METKMSTVVGMSVFTKTLFFSFFSGIAWVLTYANISVEIFSIFVSLIFIDFGTGLMKSWALKIAITSVKMRYGVASKFSLILLPVVIGLGAKAIGQDAKSLFVWGMNLLILSEVYSIIGNIYTIRTKKYLPEWDVIALLGAKIRQSMTLRDDESR